MRQAMEKVEEERAQLVAEVEAQIERALASMSMAVEMDESEEEIGSHRSASPRPRSDTGQSNVDEHSTPVRPFSTDSTLAGTAETDEETRHSLESSIIPEENDTVVSTTESNGQSTVDRSNDTMVAVDEGIHQNTDRIAQKVLQIQQKV